MTRNFWHILAIVVLFMSAKLAFAGSTGLGIFSHQRDIGNVAKPGSVNFDPATGEYLIAGGGENMWFTNDAFHFVWTKMSGDFTLTADVKFIGSRRQSASQGVPARPPVAQAGLGLCGCRPSWRRPDGASIPRHAGRHDA